MIYKYNVYVALPSKIFIACVVYKKTNENSEKLKHVPRLLCDILNPCNWDS